MAISNWKKGLTVAASVGVLGMVLAGCGTTNTTNSGGGGGNSAKPLEGGNMILDMVQGPKDLDPAKAYDTASGEIVDSLYDRLVTYEKGTNNANITGMIAKTYTHSADGKTWTFNLRTGVKFWNGDPVTAQSFIDEFERVATKATASGGEGFIEDIQGEPAFNSGKAKTISGLSAPNDHTLVIKLAQPDGQFLYKIAMPFFSAVDQSFINKVGDKTFDATQAMGSGPYELKSVNSSQIVITKNPHYWEKDSYGQSLPYLNQITFRINNNAQLDALNFEQGKTAMLEGNMGIPSSAFPHFQATPSLNKLMSHATQNSVFYLGLNNNIAPFNNPVARQAIEYAVDKQKIIKLFNGRGIVANQPLPPGLPGYQKSLPTDATYSYNPTKAKALLKQAGVKPGTTITLYSSNDPDQMKEDESVQEDLKAVGINLVIKATTWATFLNVSEAGKAQMFGSGWLQDYPDAGDFLMLFESSQAPINNSAMYKNKQVDQWMAESNATTDQSKRIQLFGQITDQTMKDAPWVPLYYPIVYGAKQSWVHGWFAPAVLMDEFQYIWIDKGHSAS
jgi:ABC-type transport system substrate-binding protein